ncbi:MAG: PLP-dependent transferase, partial [Hyphomonas sp.]|nr:PLP-dependent transferase [Hyphomonas sp.]
PMGVHVITCPTTDMMTADKTGCRLVMIETPSNPGLAVCDIAVIAARAKAAGALLVADNTTATAICQQPLDLGADLVVMSDTKAMGGHSDILAGHVAARDTSLLEPVKTWRRLAGAIVSPFDAYLLHRGMATLDVRLSRANANALAAAEALRAHPAVISVNYPGLTNDPSHEIASRQMQGFGPVVSFTLANRNAAENFIENSDMITAATSFGGVHTTAECRVRWGDAVPEGFVRLSCGIEPTADLVTSLTRALDSLA